MIGFWQLFLYQPILNLLVFFYKILFLNLGLAITALTVFVRGLTVPLTLPALKMAQKQKAIKGDLNGLKKKYNHDKRKMAEEQARLMKKHGINPLSGCLPQILQVVILIALYQAFGQVLGANGHSIENLNSLLYHPFLRVDPAVGIRTRFLYLDLAQKDPYFVLPVLAGLAQYGLSKLMAPRPDKKTGKKESAGGQKDDMMEAMSSQMTFLMPLMTVFIGVSLPAGLVLYWLAAVLFSLAQQWLMTRVWK